MHIPSAIAPKKVPPPLESRRGAEGGARLTAQKH